MSFTDSISVKALNKSSLIYAKGNKLILHVDCKKHVNKTSTNDKIHHISFRQNGDGSFRIACCAAREILVSDIVDTQFVNSFVTRMTDWISSIKVLDDGSIAAVTAHNIAVLCEVQDNKLVIKEKFRCEENSTLYCSSIYGSSWCNLMFFGGTALGELVIWKKTEGVSQIICRDFLHNGVIFSIDFNQKYLLTSSDDRSIKVFNFANDEKVFQLVEKKQLFGHTSRVFVCKIIEFNSETIFISAGEDSNVCIWSETGMLLTKKNVSASGIIWNLDYIQETEAIVTCSSTGKLNIFRLREILFEKQSAGIINAEVFPAKLKYLENGTLVVLSNNMDIHMRRRDEVNWIPIPQPINSYKYVAMEVIKNRLVFAAKNSVVVFDYSEHHERLTFTVDVNVKKMLSTSLQLDYLRAVHALSFNELLVSDASGLAVAFNVKLGKVVKLFRIPKSSEPWTVSAAKVDDLWLLGDRVGNLFLYDDNKDESEPSAPAQKLWKLHGHLGVTTIKVKTSGFVQTTGNDGTRKTLFLNRTKNPPSIEIHRSERTSVNWIEKACEWNQKEFLLGFNDNYFVIFHNRQIIYEWKCGGRHRHWDIFLDNERRVLLTYVQKKQLHFVELMLSEFTFDNADDSTWHVLDCNAIEAVCDGTILISGSEDTLMKVTRVEGDGDESKFCEIANINSHTSSIKAITTWHDGEHLWIFSVGGRAQIVVTKFIKMKHIKEEINFAVVTSVNNEKSSALDPETKFTSIFYDDKSSKVLVSCSDGFIRIFTFSKTEDSCKLELHLEHFYGKCVLKIHAIKNFILTMATDGFICFWRQDEPSKCLKLIDKLKHNQSGINCFDIVADKSLENFLLATSGDDAGIFVTRFSLESDSVLFYETISSYEFHIAQVTGIKFTSPHILYTTSIDQTICKLELDDTSMKLLDKKFSCVSDVKGFCFFNDKHFAVYGAGLELLPTF